MVCIKKIHFQYTNIHQYHIHLMTITNIHCFQITDSWQLWPTVQIDTWPQNQFVSPSASSSRATNRTQIGSPINPDSNSVPSPVPHPGCFIITLLKNCHSKVSVCYGCRQHFKTGNQPLSPPADLIIYTKMRREYIDPQDGSSRMGKTPTNVYFHCHPDCVKKKQQYFITYLAFVQPEVKPFLTITHLNYIRQIFGLGVYCFLIRLS
jgi:hypothetical protein